MNSSSMINDQIYEKKVHLIQRTFDQNRKPVLLKIIEIIVKWIYIECVILDNKVNWFDLVSFHCFKATVIHFIYWNTDYNLSFCRITSDNRRHGSAGRRLPPMRDIGVRFPVDKRPNMLYHMVTVPLLTGLSVMCPRGCLYKWMSWVAVDIIHISYVDTKNQTVRGISWSKHNLR